MIARHEVLLSLYGAWRLFLRDPRGIEWLDTSIEGYWKSFFCAVVVLPGYALWVVSRDYSLVEAGFFRILTVEGIEYVIQWVAWPLIMAYIAPVLDRSENYIRYIVAFNWGASIYILIALFILAVEHVGFMPKGIIGLVMLSGTIIVLLYHWYILRIGLEVSGVGAAGLVASEFILSHFIDAIGQSMLQ